MGHVWLLNVSKPTPAGKHGLAGFSSKCSDLSILPSRRHYLLPETCRLQNGFSYLPGSRSFPSLQQKKKRPKKQHAETCLWLGSLITGPSGRGGAPRLPGEEPPLLRDGRCACGSGVSPTRSWSSGLSSLGLRRAPPPPKDPRAGSWKRRRPQGLGS